MLPSAAPVRPLGSRLERRVSTLVARPLFWVVLVTALGAWPLVWSLASPLPKPLPVITTLPRFELTDQSGQPFGTRDLDGRVWVASFIFTRCTTACPTITTKMAAIQARTRQLEPALHLVSFSVDPGWDSPTRLAEYARTRRASPRMWTFLTGSSDAVRAAVVDGLEVAMGTERGADGAARGQTEVSYVA